MLFILVFIFRIYFIRLDLDIIKLFFISYLVIDFVFFFFKEFVFGMKDVDCLVVVFIFWSNDLFGSIVFLYGLFYEC